MGFSGFHHASMADVFAEHAALTRHTNIDISGLSYRRLQEEGSMQWPVPHEKHPGTARLFTDRRFYTPNEKARFFSLAARHLSEATSPVWPLFRSEEHTSESCH